MSPSRLLSVCAACFAAIGLIDYQIHGSWFEVLRWSATGLFFAVPALLLAVLCMKRKTDD